eukprot:CAMPEP_0184363580 /NCGR_PEP_ID=MMETSP1089-20130417/140330_1 /TAXON_ID=38269 ORGANISM="Gloeochaete wittrockiana, Strain SAG46.84" /NCGR_SAMPLE_ID=MMETSP1089 /ASSEMBLY_ACC=CAM_ASM_000445 /LENGTH=54 /DNA_ID=CAMNT_0026704127 /DNA_START=411 /DNA_END=575 /DNA_ORIENTATION=+
MQMRRVPAVRLIVPFTGAGPSLALGLLVLLGPKDRARDGRYALLPRGLRCDPDA